MASVARSRWILLLLLVVAVVAIWRTRRKPPQYSVAYVADRAATLWSTTAQVRQPVAMLGYGEKVAVLRRAGDQEEVQTDDGTHGWVDVSLLMEPDLWQRSEDLLAHAGTLTVQASGRTRNVSNAHIEPGRETPRIYQFGRDVPVVVLERKVLPVPASASDEKASGDEAAAPEDDKPKQEDWLLVSRAEGRIAGAASPGGASPITGGSAAVTDGIPVAGWVLARFIDLDPPAPIPDYATSAGLRVVGWAVLNTVPSAAGEKPQYVVAATRGGEGQPCDFTALRVYTWGEKQQQYETAYAESDFCGALPIRVRQTSAGPEFRFAERDKGTGERVYVMRQTTVRRVKESESLAGKKS
jgi:hypothetical protein